MVPSSGQRLSCYFPTLVDERCQLPNFYARTRSEPPQEVELWFENQESASKAFTRALIGDGRVTDDHGRTFKNLAVEYPCRPEEGFALSLPPEFAEMVILGLSQKICLRQFTPAEWNPRLGFYTAAFILCYRIKNAIKRMKSMIKGVENFLLVALPLGLGIYEISVIGGLALLNRIGVFPKKKMRKQWYTATFIRRYMVKFAIKWAKTSRIKRMAILPFLAIALGLGMYALSVIELLDLLYRIGRLLPQKQTQIPSAAGHESEG